MLQGPVVREIASVPFPDAGAPSPIVWADEHTVRLSYSAAGGSEDRPTIVEFAGVYCFTFGSPNDESLAGHPLYPAGLRPYGVFEIEHSAWWRRAERINSVHPRHDVARFGEYRHLVWTFHDSTFECLARAFVVRSKD
jgi:hypothetical protein